MIQEKLKEFKKFGSKLGLHRMKNLMEKLGNPQRDLKVIHIGGTNGKGSVSKYIYEGLQGNGYKVGIFNSPYIEHIQDMIQFDDKHISEDELDKVGDDVFEACRKIKSLEEEMPTEFEVITAIAFLYFKKVQADFVILEVGLGGVGDSTNIVENPLISVINNISMDHIEFLGDTISEIAREKAGIVKKGVPMVIGVEDKEAQKVIARKCYEIGSELFDASKTKYTVEKFDETGSKFSTVIEYTNYGGVEISMVGEHQIKNAMVALTVIEVLRQKGIIKIERSRLYSGLKKAKQKCRMEIINDEFEIPVILDGAHNKAGAEALKETINRIFPDKRIRTVMSILKDKDLDAIVSKVLEFSDDIIITDTDNPRVTDSWDLMYCVEKHNGKAEEIKPLEKAIVKALEIDDKCDILLFTGSLDFVGKVRLILCGAVKPA